MISTYPIQPVLDKLQINKVDLAQFIGISKSHLTKVCAGQFQLSDRQIIQLNVLYSLAFKTEENAAFIKARLVQEAQSLKAELTARNEALQAEVEQLQLRLQDTETEHLKALSALEKLDTLANGKHPLSAEQMFWVENLRSYWDKFLPRMDHSQQYRLQLRLQVCKLEMESNANKINEL
jgi:plasmid maintenance system antidote protein VapI